MLDKDGAVAEQLTAALCVASSLAQNKIFVWPTDSCSGSGCVCEFICYNWIKCIDWQIFYGGLFPILIVKVGSEWEVTKS